MVRAIVVVAWLGATAVMAPACGQAEVPTGQAAVCERESLAAKQRVTQAASADQPCELDADCVSVPIVASCFDACWASLNKPGRAAVDRAATIVEASECKVWKEAGCTLTAPPCAPPAAPRCDRGRCQ